MSTVQPGQDNFLEANKAHFDSVAHEFDNFPHAIERAKRSAAKMREVVDFDPDSTIVMEYACGTGLVSRELAPYAKRIVGIDISQGVVDQFNLRVHNQGIDREEMEAFCIELKGQEGELNDEKFDVIVCTSAYHHFPDIDAVTRMLTFFLKQGGSLIVVDLMKNTGTHSHGTRSHGPGEGHTLIPEKFHHIVPHKGGLDQSDIKKAFEGAGLESFLFDDSMIGKDDARLFIAKGIKGVK
ncbi:hypothetical protein H0H93_008498 [Arthromyces matolae]|nr:hypothetical protein H0H93_008498 [Arthromyces matolae]